MVDEVAAGAEEDAMLAEVSLIGLKVDDESKDANDWPSTESDRFEDEDGKVSWIRESGVDGGGGVDDENLLSIHWRNWISRDLN